MKSLILLCIFSTALASSHCGLHLPSPDSNPARYTRSIIGGRNVTTPSKWPWQLMLDSYSDTPTFCGGTLISSQWVLTAAHCVENRSASETIVYKSITQHPRWQLHLLNPNHTSEDFQLINLMNRPDFKEIINANNILKVAEIVMHPEYNASIESLANDIALMKLETPQTYDDTVAPICLPTPYQLIPTDGQAVATGFGKVEDPSTNNATMGLIQLREVIVPILSNETCTVRSEGRNVICANSLRHGPHQGDSGGPLMMKARDGRWFQLGITSFMRTDQLYVEANLNAFTDVRNYCEWIKENTNGEASCQDEEVVLDDVEIKI